MARYSSVKASSPSSTIAGSFCGSPAGAESGDAGFYEMTCEEIDTTTAEAEDFMQFQVSHYRMGRVDSLYSCKMANKLRHISPKIIPLKLEFWKEA